MQLVLYCTRLYLLIVTAVALNSQSLADSPQNFITGDDPHQLDVLAHLFNSTSGPSWIIFSTNSSSSSWSPVPWLQTEISYCRFDVNHAYIYIEKRQATCMAAWAPIIVCASAVMCKSVLVPPCAYPLCHCRWAGVTCCTNNPLPFVECNNSHDIVALNLEGFGLDVGISAAPMNFMQPHVP